MKKTILFGLIIMLIIDSGTTHAGNPPVVKWTAHNSFEQKVFIENKGQYELAEKNIISSDILFGARQDGLQYYFTASGIWIKKLVTVKRSQEEIKDLEEHLDAEKPGEDNDKALQYKFEEEFHYLGFIGTNTSVEIIPSHEVRQVYNFCL